MKGREVGWERLAELGGRGDGKVKVRRGGDDKLGGISRVEIREEGGRERGDSQCALKGKKSRSSRGEYHGASIGDGEGQCDWRGRRRG